MRTKQLGLTIEPEEDNTPKKPLSQIGFLHSLLPDVSLTNVSNFQVEPYKKDSQMIRALMAELISSFKDLAQLAPIFRDQSEQHLAVEGLWATH